MNRPKLTYANVMSTIAVFIALGGTSYAVARNSIGTAQLRSNAVTSAKVKNGSLRTGDLAPSARTGQRGPRGPQGPPGTTAGSPATDPTPEPWTPMDFATGWSNYAAGGLDTAAFRKDKQGEVHLRGTAAKPGVAPVRAETMAVLPPGYRPTGTQIFETASQGDGPAQITLRPDGALLWVNGFAAADGNFVSLNGITFYAG